MKDEKRILDKVEFCQKLETLLYLAIVQILQKILVYVCTLSLTVTLISHMMGVAGGGRVELSLDAVT